VREASDYFDDIQDVKITRDMLDLARHIVEQKSAHFMPDKFEDHYEAALTELINKKRTGMPIDAPAKPRGDNVINLMDALKRSLSGTKPASTPPVKAKKTKKRIEGQREMLLPISGSAKRAAKVPVKDMSKTAAKPPRAGARSRKAS
jgi:DNA end-binding protein Ku